MNNSRSIFEELRAKCHISQRELANGICTPQFFSKVERGEKEFDKLEFDILLERMGENPDKLEYILSDVQYIKIDTREEAEDGIIEGNKLKALHGLVKYRKTCELYKSVDNMFFYRTLGFYYMDCKKDFANAQQYLMKAIEATMPDYDFGELTGRWSTWEVENLIGYGKAIYSLGQTRKASDIFLNCYTYAKDILDEELRSRILPKCVYCCVSSCEWNSDRIISACEEAIELLRNQSVSYFMAPIIEILIRAYQWEERDEELIEYWIHFRDSLYEIMNEYIPNRLRDAIFFRFKQCTYHLESEIIYGERVRQKMSQASLGDGIYKELKSISDIERGKTSPNKTKYPQLMEKLGIYKGRMEPFVSVNSYSEIVAIWEIRKALGRNDLKSVQKALKEVSFANQKQVELYSNSLSKEDIRELIEETYPIEDEKYYRPPFQWEMDAISVWARKEFVDDSNAQIAVLKKLKRAYLDSRRNPKYCYRLYAAELLLEIWTLAKMQKQDDIKGVTDEAFTYSLLCGKGSILSEASCGKTCEEGLCDTAKIKYAYMGVVFDDLYKSKAVKEKQEYYQYVCREVHNN